MTGDGQEGGDLSQIEATAERLLRGMPAALTLDGRLAVGFEGGGASIRESWMILDFSSHGEPVIAELHKSLVEPIAHDALKSDIVVSAKWSTWQSEAASSFPGLLDLIDQGKIRISGRLNYFIRHARSTTFMIFAVATAAQISRHPA